MSKPDEMRFARSYYEGTQAEIKRLRMEKSNDQLMANSIIKEYDAEIERLSQTVSTLEEALAERDRRIKRLQKTLQIIANDGCGMAIIKDNKTFWCPDLYERDDWCWCCIARSVLEADD